MADGDGLPLTIDLARVEGEILVHGQGLRGEGLVASIRSTSQSSGQPSPAPRAGWGQSP